MANMAPSEATRIAIIGSGTIGLSFAALHLSKNPTCTVTIFDTRPDLSTYVSANLPGYLIDGDVESCTARLSIVSTLQEAVRNADIIEEQGPENLAFKASLWPQIEEHAQQNALLWSSTSGIPASEQNRDMKDKSRLLVVHPYNPPHIMPLLEVVPSPQTAQTVIDRTLEYWRRLGRSPVVMKKECTGFVSNRLAFALLREAISLVQQGVLTVEECDEVVQTSMGPRWTVAGPFKSYHAGGGEGGLASFMEKIGGTVDACWRTAEDDIKREGIDVGGAWQEVICKQAEDAYGRADTAERDRKTRAVLDAVRK